MLDGAGASNVMAAAQPVAIVPRACVVPPPVSVPQAFKGAGFDVSENNKEGILKGGNDMSTSADDQRARQLHGEALDDLTVGQIGYSTHDVDQHQVTEGGDDDGARVDGTSLWASRAMLVGVAIIYGTNFGCVKLLEESVPVSLAAALRFSVAVIPFIPFLRVTPGVFKAGVEVGKAFLVEKHCGGPVSRCNLVLDDVDMSSSRY